MAPQGPLALRTVPRAQPQQVAVQIGYDEPFAHRVFDERDRAVLVSMTRMLDRQAGLSLRWVEDINACTTLFVPHDWSQYVSPPRVLVRLTPRGATPARSPR